MTPDFDPFGECADPRCYVPLATSERILSELSARIQEGASPILVAGPSGVGKTLLLHVLGENARLCNQRVVYSPFLHLDPDECAPWLLHLLGIPASKARSAEAALLEELSSRASRPTLLMVDEIQAAPEASVRKLAEIAQAGRPALRVVVAGSEGRHLRKRIPVLAPEIMQRFPKSLPDDEIGALYGAILERPELSERVRRALARARPEILRAASGLPRLLKAELDIRAQNILLRRGPRREPIEELCLDTWMPAAPAAAAPPPERAHDLAREPAREPAPELPRRLPPRRPVRETIGAWAARAALEAQRGRERLSEAALHAGSAARLQRDVALARGALAARTIRSAAPGVRNAVASALGEAGGVLLGAGGVALPAAALCALVLFVNSDFFGIAPRDLAPIDAAPLPSPAAPEPVAPPVHVQAQINARPWARIRIDGVDVGPTPLSRALAPGVHRIEAEFADGRSLERRVEIGPEQRFVALP